MVDAPIYAYDADLSPSPVRRGKRWWAQILLSEKTMTALVFRFRPPVELEDIAQYLGSCYEADYCYCFFDEARQKMVFKFEYLRKPRKAIGKALTSRDESSESAKPDQFKRKDT